MAIEDPLAYNEYLDTLGLAADVCISTYDDLVKAIRVRHDYFHDNWLQAFSSRPGASIL